MRRIFALGALAALCLGTVASAQEARSQGTEAIQTFKGTVESVNPQQKTLLLEDTSGTAEAVSWDSSTALQGGEPKEGQSVEVSAVKRDGRTVATRIQVLAAKPAR